MHDYQLAAVEAGMKLGKTQRTTASFGARRSGKSALVEATITSLLRQGRSVVVWSAKKFYVLRMDDPCDDCSHWMGGDDDD